MEKAIMATTESKRPRRNVDAVSQLATLPERVIVLETKVDNIEEKLDDVRSNIKDMHDCLDNTRDLLAEKLEQQNIEYRANSTKFYEHVDKLHAEDKEQHQRLATKVEELESFKSKWTYLVAGGIAAAGFVSGHLGDFIKLFH
jgi:uncharacterized protein (DUF3084 family)